MARRVPGEDEATIRLLRFRSYQPRDESLQVCKSNTVFSILSLLRIWIACDNRGLTCGEHASFYKNSKVCDDPQDPVYDVTLVQSEQDQLLSHALSKFASTALDLDNMIPQKSNWELKRALKPRLDQLERRTQRALVELAHASVPKKTGISGTEPSYAHTVTVAATDMSDSSDGFG